METGINDIYFLVLDALVRFDPDEYRKSCDRIERAVKSATAEPETPLRKLSHKQLQRLTTAERAEYQRRRTARVVDSAGVA